MKYIRTKDGIVDVTDPNFTRFCEFKIENNILKTHYYCENFWNEEEIIAQAETIEELCDEFVIVIDKKPNGYLIFNQCMNSFEKVISIHKNTKNENTIYGAIWTEWGLKYVAKMNEKGELELL